jgi:hypothetical protein
MTVGQGRKLPSVLGRTAGNSEFWSVLFMGVLLRFLPVWSKWNKVAGEEYRIPHPDLHFSVAFVIGLADGASAYGFTFAGCASVCAGPPRPCTGSESTV